MNYKFKAKDLKTGEYVEGDLVYAKVANFKTERLAIIDHSSHTLYVDDVDGELIDEQYEGSEEKYIEDNYTFQGDYSWDYIVDAQYFPSPDDPTPMEIDFENLKD